jgi:hypothetical protein
MVTNYFEQYWQRSASGAGGCSPLRTIAKTDLILGCRVFGFLGLYPGYGCESCVSRDIFPTTQFTNPQGFSLWRVFLCPMPMTALQTQPLPIANVAAIAHQPLALEQ